MKQPGKAKAPAKRSRERATGRTAETAALAVVLLGVAALVTFLLWKRLPKEPGAESVESLVVPVTYGGGTFVIVNPTDAAWSDVELDLNRMGRLSAGYRYRIDALGPHQAASIEAPSFAGADGSHFDPGFMPPSTLFITMQLANGHFGTSLYRFK